MIKAKAQTGRATADDRRLRLRSLARDLSSIVALNWPLLLIVVLGVALRLWMIGVSPLDPRFSTADDGDYYKRALRFAVTGQYIDDSWLIRPPLHVFFFALWLKLALLIGRPALGIPLIELAQTAISALTVVLGYASARRLFASARAGLFFAAFLALWYSFVEQPTVLFSELLYLFLFLLHFWLLLRFDAGGRMRDLALSGVALGAAALTRSPALYSLTFVVLWLLIRFWRAKNKEQRTNTLPSADTSLFSVLRSLFLVVACCLAVVLPWTARNYIVYRRVIPVDTLGQINLWLDLDRVDQREVHISTLRQMPQADRAPYALAHARAILAADPLRPFRPMWETFQHIWKAQYVEDYFVKRSFFTRALRATAPLGLAGDLIWLVYTLGGLIGLALPVREGLHNRLLLLAWLGYAFLTVLIFHVEPRYLLPIWTLIGLYGAWALSKASGKRQKAEKTPRTFFSLTVYLLPSLLVLAFLVLVLSYRNYPAIIASGVARERGMIAGERAYVAGDYTAAERAFRAALAAQPDFIDGQLDLALALAAQGRRGEARALLTPGDSRRSDLAIGALARDMGDIDAAREPLARAEGRAGEDIQRWALDWLRPPPIDNLVLSDGLDLGYIGGFSGAESDPTTSFRWLSGDGRVVLPLPKPLTEHSMLLLRMTSGRPNEVPLDIWIGDHWVGQVPVASGQWRVYRVPVPPELAGQQRIDIRLRAPTFVPAREMPGSDDARMLSLMISQVRVQ
jgi:hypothetical protein